MPFARRSVLLAVAPALLLATSAVAHHGWSWAESDQTEMTGTVQSVSHTPPHPSIVVEVEGQVWHVDLGNPGRTQRSGFVEGVAEEGDEVTIIGNRSLNEDEALIKAVRITIDGKNYDMYPERIQGD